MRGKELSGEPESVYIGLGSNAGCRFENLQKALRRLAATEGVDVREASNVYETEAHLLPGQQPQPDHLNAVALVMTTLAPLQLLEALKEIERAAGRDPAAERWAPRPLDLDILVFGDRILSTENLEIPHPRIAERRFVLEPFCELAPDLILPGTREPIRKLLSECSDSAHVTPTRFILRT